MEQDCITGLYRSLGKSVGAELSSEDVSLLYHKVFHVSSHTEEAHVAMKKTAGGDNTWSCVGENVLDVLLEMEREKQKKETLYWDLQLLNVGNLSTLYEMDKHVSVDPHWLNGPHQSTDPKASKQAARGKELCGGVRGVKRLKKAARQCWARLASESVHSVLPSASQGQSVGVRGQAWGCVSLSDVLLLLEVKYDAVTHLLYAEMLQEHYTLSIWETLLPWQQHKKEEELGDLADEALASGDMLRLAELPGALREYRFSPRSRPEGRAQCCSAVSLLYELCTFRQQERDTLTVLGERLDRESLRLACIYIRLATLRAQREKVSYSALLAARQSWETWPLVKSPCRAEQAALWLHGEEEEEEHKKDFISASPQQENIRSAALALLQQAVLQLLVLTQEQERRHLVRLAHGLSIQDLQAPGCTVPPKEDCLQQAALRNGCKKRLRQIHADLQTHNDTQTHLKQTHLQPQLQPNISSQPAMWYQHRLEDCSLLLLTHLMELQEVQVSVLLPALMGKSVQWVQARRDAYESELQAQRYTNLLQLLSDAPPTYSTHENCLNEQIPAVPCCGGLTDALNSSGGLAEAPTVDSTRRASGELHGPPAAAEWNGQGKEDVCKGCGAVMEDLPYLEILCVSDATSESLAAARGAQEEEVGVATESLHSHEKQGSLITCAWSKPPMVDTEYEEGAAVRVTGQSQDVQPSDASSTAVHTPGESDREEGKHTLFHSDFKGHPNAEQQRGAVGQLTLVESTIADQPEKGESEGDLQTHALAAETLHAAQPHLRVDTPEMKRRGGDVCPELMNDAADVDIEVEMCPAATESQLWDLRGPEAARAEDQKYNTHATFDSSPADGEAMRESTLMEKERAREPVSEMERERTMQNLVDMQRKVEQRQQRERERQLLRVQERLSIIQNRKAEEDLLGVKHTDRLKHLTQDLPQEDKNQQKTVVRERLEQLRRERSYVMQSKRDRNTAGFKELLGPAAPNSSEADEGADRDAPAASINV